MESRLHVKMNSPETARTVSTKRKEPGDIQDIDQSMESRLHVKMNSPDTARTVSTKRKEPGDIQDIGSTLYLAGGEDRTGGGDCSDMWRFDAQNEKWMKMASMKEGRAHFNTSPALSSVKTKGFCCDQCGQSFASVYYLKVHQRIHTDHKPYCCEQCGKIFTLKSSLLTHMRVHTGVKPFSCELCGKCFSQSGSLKTHMLIHTGEKPYCCDQCGKSFSQKSSLNQHKRIHTGEKPYCCDQCGEKFHRLDMFKNHQRIHTGEEPYKCDQCGKSFTLQSSLKRHKWKVKCFTQDGRLETHQCIHPGEKPDPSRTISIKQEEPQDHQDLKKHGPKRKRFKKEPTNSRKADVPGIRAGYYPPSERQQVALLMKMTAEEPANSPGSDEQLGVIGCVVSNYQGPLDIKEEEPV